MITIVSGKGGVGKSIIATNLALVLNRPHPGSVVLVDLSLQFGDIAALLAMTPEARSPSSRPATPGWPTAT